MMYNVALILGVGMQYCPWVIFFTARQSISKGGLLCSMQDLTTFWFNDFVACRKNPKTVGLCCGGMIQLIINSQYSIMFGW